MPVTDLHVLQLGRNLALVGGTTQAAQSLHTRLLEHVLKLRMSFFNSNPSGRLVNAFSKDLHTGKRAVQPALTS